MAVMPISGAEGVSAPAEPPPDCARCARLTDFRKENALLAPDWFNRPVPSFGDPAGRLLVVGLAPGLRGANRTGRPFTGDFAGELLYGALLEHGFATGKYDARPDDGLVLRDAMITNAVRCVPPENRPTGGEITGCQPFLAARLASLPNLRAAMVLGRIAHDSTIQALHARKSAFAFKHGARHLLPRPGAEPLAVFDSYHCSRYNTNTGRLTPEMFRSVLAAIRGYLDAGGATGHNNAQRLTK